MGPAVLFFLALAAAAPLLLAAQTLGGYSTSKLSTVWTNSNGYFDSYSRDIIVANPQTHSGIPAYFAAGFFCVSSSLSLCDEFLFAVYIGNVASSIYDPLVVWSANRDHPVRENATLEFTLDGNLVLCDADGSHVWSSNTSSQSVAGMLISEIGNLVLLDHMNATVWQSFDHPTDTIVPGQSLVEGMRLTANTSASNTTRNQFYVIIFQDELSAYVDSTPPQLYFSSSYKYEYMDEYFTMSNRTVKSTQYMRLDSDGHLRVSGSFDTNWTDVMGLDGMDDCDYPTVCGKYGICTRGQCYCPFETNSSSIYFNPVDERIPNLGCTPLNPISCQEIQHHQLLALPNISYFDLSYMDMTETSITDCKQSCLKNCSCMAILFSYNQYFPNGRCKVLTEVFSLQSIQPESFGYSSAYLKVYLRPSISASTSNKKTYNLNRKKVMVGATLGAVTTLALFVIVVILYLQRRRKYEDGDEEFDFDQFPGMPTRFSFAKLSECTEGFNKKLGEGGFGSVFEGRLGEERVAVKRLEGARQGKKEFLAEVETIGSIEHINLVSLIGFCVEKAERLLVYEYMSRGSLDRWIYYRHNNAPLDWYTRFRIILDIAKGLCYLHEGCKRKIAHLDIKPQNILLDENFNAKVADFGLCKLINRDQSKVVTVMRGTPGYLAPEWLTSRITEKVDVYSFGIVVMEIVSGRKNIDNSQSEENDQLINLLREKAQNNKLVDLIDKHSEDLVSHQEEVVQMIKLAIWCLQHDITQRPSMSIVIKVLEGAISIETFDASSLIFVQDNPSACSVLSQASILSGPR